MELDYMPASRLLLVPVVNICESIKNWFQLIYPNLSWLQYCVLLPCEWVRNILHKWFVTTVLTLPTHVLWPQNFVRIFCNDSEAMFAYFSPFSKEVKHFYQKNTSKNSQIIFILRKWFNIWNNFGKELASEGVEAVYIAGTIFIFYSYFKSCGWLLLVAVTLPVTSASCERSFSKIKLLKKFPGNSMTSERLGNVDLLSVERVRAAKIDLDDFVDEFDSRQDNRKIKVHWVNNDIKI